MPQPLLVRLQGLAPSKPQLGFELWVQPVSWPSGAESCWGYCSAFWWWWLLFSGVEGGQSWHGDDAVHAQWSAAPPIARCWGMVASWGI